MFAQIKTILRNSDTLAGDFAGAAALGVMLMALLHIPVLT
jgi:hypothetical protein